MEIDVSVVGKDSETLMCGRMDALRNAIRSNLDQQTDQVYSEIDELLGGPALITFTWKATPIPLSPIPRQSSLPFRSHLLGGEGALVVLVAMVGKDDEEDSLAHAPIWSSGTANAFQEKKPMAPKKKPPKTTRQPRMEGR
jgi:hypothetical protein